MIMRRKNQTVLSTVIGIFLTVSVQVDHHGQRSLITRHILPLTNLLAWFFNVIDGWQYLTAKPGAIRLRWQTGFTNIFSNTHYRLFISWTLIQIGFRSILYGTGITV